MLIFDNIIFSLQKHGGISVLWGELINYIQNKNINQKFIEYDNALQNKIRCNLSIPSENLQIKSSKLLNLKRYLNPHLNYSSPFIFHSSHYRISNYPNAINITTVHDFTYERYRKGLAKQVHIWQKYQAINKSDAIICISENTKKDLLYYLPHIDEKKIHIIYNGVSDKYRVIKDKEEEYSDYLVFVGAREGYKNFNFIVESLKNTNERLLICGSQLSEQEIYFLNKNLSPERYENIIFPSSEKLNVILNSSKALVYPSLYEGFGIPIIEAQKAGCPVIAMNSSSIPEIIGNKSTLLNSNNSSELLEKLRLLSNYSIREEIIAEGLENSKRFSWSKMAKSYFDLYNSFIR